MIIQIESQNTKLLDILHKNPNTDNGLYLTALKNGVVVGNAISQNKYDVVFQDTKGSYLPEDSGSLDYQSYCSPLVILDIVSALFSHIIRERTEYENKEITWLLQTYREIDNTECHISIPNFYIYSGWMRDEEFLLAKYFPQIEVTRRIGHNCQLNIKAPSVFEAINIMSLVSVFTHITNRHGVFTYIDDLFAKKYARILTNIADVPYFVYYLFIKRTVKTVSQFEEVKTIFESALAKDGIKAELTYYPTHLARIHYITDKIKYTNPILDIGCGELLYYKSVMKKHFFEEYFAVDEDPKFEYHAESMNTKMRRQNLHFSISLDEVPREKQYTILLTEVIEHNTIEDAMILVKKACEFSMDQCIITTPNSEFNKYYNQDGDMRHDDHDFEFTSEEFKTFISDCLVGFPNLEVEYDYIGDKLNEIQPTQVAIIKPRIGNDEK